MLTPKGVEKNDDRVAQWLAQNTFNVWVESSNLSAVTNYVSWQCENKVLWKRIK